MTSVVSCQQEFPCLFYRQEIVTGQCPALLSRYRHIINTNYTSCYCQSSLIPVRSSPLSFASVIETQIKYLHSSQKALIMLLIFDTERHIERDAAGRGIAVFREFQNSTVMLYQWFNQEEISLSVTQSANFAGYEC